MGEGLNMVHKISKAILIASTALSLIGCVTAEGETRLEQAYTPEVHFATFQARFTSNDPGQEAASFLRAFNAGHQDVLILSGGTVSGRDAVIARLNRDWPHIQVVSTTGLLVGPVTATLERAIASSPACSPWSKDPTRVAARDAGPGFGCASSSALAQMIADPRDLMGGRAAGPQAAQPFTIGISQRNANALELTPETSTGGTTE